MNEDVLLEVVKALALEIDINDIANMAEVEVEDIEKIAKDYKVDIEDRKKAEL